MRNFLAVLAVLVGAFVLSISPAFGADLLQATTFANDGGTSANVTLQAQAYYSVQCTAATCLHFDGGVANCDTDVRMGLQPASAGGPAVFEARFESASSTIMRVKAADAGVTNCNIYLQTRNLNSLYR